MRRANERDGRTGWPFPPPALAPGRGFRRGQADLHFTHYLCPLAWKAVVQVLLSDCPTLVDRGLCVSTALTAALQFNPIAAVRDAPLLGHWRQDPPPNKRRSEWKRCPIRFDPLPTCLHAEKCLVVPVCQKPIVMAEIGSHKRAQSNVKRSFRSQAFQMIYCSPH